MAVENQNANPIIIEPAASSNPGTPSGLLTPSLNASSSSSSFESTRSRSRASSATSTSEFPSPDSRDVELTNIRPPVTPNEESLPPSSPISSGEQARQTTISSTPSPPERVDGSSHSSGIAWLSSCCPVLSNRRWLEQSLGIFGLVASLVALLFIGVRTYKLAVITTENSTLDGCTGLIQAGVTTFENSTQLCKIIMKTGPLSSPYHLGKRTLYSSLTLVSKWTKGSPRQTCHFPYIGCQPKYSGVINWNISTPAVIISTTLALGALLLTLARQNARSTEVFTSPACSDIHITHHRDSGPRTISGQGIIERRDSKNHGLDEIHKQSRASQDLDNLMEDTTPLRSLDNSSTTLVDGCSESKISIHDKSSGEKHEGLVEFQMNGHTRVFFKFETGEFFHLKHWKGKCKHASDSSHDKKDPLSVKGEGLS